MAGSITRDTGTKRTGSASVKVVADSVNSSTLLQSVNVGDTNSYTLVAYAYTTGSAVTTADLDLWFNGAEVTTTFTADSPAGWYKLSGTLTGVASSVGYGVRVHGGKTVYVDDMSLLGPAPATTAYILNSGTGGVAALDVESSVTASNFVSDVAVGTQPYATTSTTKNTNLNADAVDGVNAASMTNGKLVRYNSTGTTIETGTVAESSGALSAVTTIGMSGQLTNTLAIGTSPFAVTSTTVNTNLNADMLDGKHVGTSGNTVPLLDGANTWSGAQTVDANLVVNEAGSASVDTRIESDTKANMLFLDASADAIGINNASPSAYLHIGAGGTAAGSSPLKLTTQASGLTAVEQGAFELIGNSLQFTQLAKRRGVAMTQDVITSSITVQNSTTESAALITAEHGANYLEVGKMEEIALYGTLEQRSNPSAVLTFNIKYAGSTIHTIATTANNVIAVGSPFIMRVTCTVRSIGATGTMQINSWLEVPGETSKGGSTLATIDTTTTQNTTITVQWGEANAANILIVQQGRVLCIEKNK